MKPKETEQSPQNDLFREELANLLNLNHELCQLANIIDWDYLNNELGQFYTGESGQPPKSIRLMAGLHYLKHAFALSDEHVIERWVENPYWQYFCGMQHFQHQPPIDPTSMTRFRQRIGETGCEKMLAVTIQAGIKTETVKEQSLNSVTVDTTVMENNITFPTDSALLNKARNALVKLTRIHGIKLRQTYERVSKKLEAQASRYFHAKQFKRGQKAVKKIKCRLGRVIRDIERQIEHCPSLTELFSTTLYRAKTLFNQKKNDKNKLYSLHEPATVCISKGKAHKRYEFGCKVSLAVTNRDNFVVCCQALEGNPYDGHTLAETLETTKKLTGVTPERCFVDKGYKGHKIEESGHTTKVYISGQKRGMKSKALKKALKRRSAIEPVISHIKSDGLLERSFLKGMDGNKYNAILCGAGHNFRLILKKLRLLFAWIFLVIIASKNQTGVRLA